MSLESFYNSLYARLDSIIIWPHGVKYFEQIISRLGKYDFVPLKIYNVSHRQLEKFIDHTYENDKVPYYHIRSKKKFIKKNSGNTFCIFFKNPHPQISANGEGHFRHIECNKVRLIKNEIRRDFNPYKNNSMTEDHVIHATDDPAATMHLLKFFGESYSDLLSKNIFNLPHHIDINKFDIEHININSISCNIACQEPESLNVQTIPIDKSPHYQFLLGNRLPYLSYINKYRGYVLTDYYSENKFQNLMDRFAFTEMPPIVVKKLDNNNYIIQDGLHRACLSLLNQHIFIPAIIL